LEKSRVNRAWASWYARRTNIDGVKKDFEKIDKLYSEALDLSNKKSYKSAIKSKFYTLEKHVGARKALA
jgi:hypothetical protein